MHFSHVPKISPNFGEYMAQNVPSILNPVVKTVVVPSILNPLEKGSGTKYTRPAWIYYVAPGTTDVHLFFTTRLARARVSLSHETHSALPCPSSTFTPPRGLLVVLASPPHQPQHNININTTSTSTIFIYYKPTLR